MRIELSFYSLKDLSGLPNGEKLLEILLSNGFIVDKIDEFEPIKRDFTQSNFQQIWNGRCGVASEHSSASLLFKGKKEVSFSGMASWNLYFHPNCKCFNGVSLSLTITKKYDIGKLTKIGDELFTWTNAVYGYITEKSKNTHHIMRQIGKNYVSIGNIYDGIPSLLWTTYFGTPYISEEDFNLPNSYVPVDHGARITITEAPDDEHLEDLNFLKANYEIIGECWFWPFERIEKRGNILMGILPSNFKKSDIRVPRFDSSALTRINKSESIYE